MLASCPPSSFAIPSIWKSVAGLPAARVGCTAFGYWHARGATFARNLDWPDPDGMLKASTRLVKLEARPTGSFRNRLSGAKPGPFQSLTFPGYSAVLTGFAPGRFAVSLNSVAADGGAGMGAAPSLLTRQALETCDTCGQAIRMLSATPLVCGALFTVVNAAPRAGDMAGVVIERTPTRFHLRHGLPVGGKDQVVCATKDFHVLDAPGRASAAGDCDLAATSCDRYHTVVEGLKAARDGLRDDQPVPLADIKAILARTQFGWTVHAAVFGTGGKSIRWE